CAEIRYGERTTGRTGPSPSSGNPVASSVPIANSPPGRAIRSEVGRGDGAVVVLVAAAAGGSGRWSLGSRRGEQQPEPPDSVMAPSWLPPGRGGTRVSPRAPGPDRARASARVRARRAGRVPRARGGHRR